MRIVFVSYNYSPGIHSPQEWVERIKFYVGWLECLAKAHDVIRVDQINYEGQFTHNGVKYHFVNDGKKKNYFPRKLNSFVKDLKPDVVVVSSFAFPLQVIQLRSCLGKDVKIIIQHHAEKPFTGLKKVVQEFASRKADAFLFASHETGADWVRKGNLDDEQKVKELMEVSSTFYPISKSIARERIKIKGTPVFLWVGRLDQNKDPLTAIKAFLRFLELQPTAKLYMIYHTNELLPAIKAILPSNNSPVILVGKVQHDELLYWYNSADFFLLASHYEGSGTALCEAMSCGCIPVVTNIPSFKTICGNCGLLFKPGDENELFSKLQQTLQLNRDHQSKSAMEQFKQELSFEAIAAKFQLLIS